MKIILNRPYCFIFSTTMICLLFFFHDWNVDFAGKLLYSANDVSLTRDVIKVYQTYNLPTIRGILLVRLGFCTTNEKILDSFPRKLYSSKKSRKWIHKFLCHFFSHFLNMYYIRFVSFSFRSLVPSFINMSKSRDSSISFIVSKNMLFATMNNL